MEKYAVDSTDKKESEARTMVKTGEAKNIKDARSKVSEANKDGTPKEEVE